MEERIQFLAEQLGGQEALSNWMNEYQYDERGFRAALARAIASAWMRDQIIADVPTTAEHVRAVQILLYEADEADEVMAQLQAGNNFGNLALTYDPITGGDLGWFPRGYLPDTQLEEAAFALAPGEYTPVIRTLAGFPYLDGARKRSTTYLSPGSLPELAIPGA